MVNFFFDGWEPVARILVVGTLAYTALVLLLRVSGKRTLAQMNGFDFVVTVQRRSSWRPTAPCPSSAPTAPGTAECSPGPMVPEPTAGTETRPRAGTAADNL